MRVHPFKSVRAYETGSCARVVKCFLCGIMTTFNGLGKRTEKVTQCATFSTVGDLRALVVSSAATGEFISAYCGQFRVNAKPKTQLVSPI